jgi:hypothetical protein
MLDWAITFVGPMQRLVPLIEEKGAEVHMSLSRTFVLKYEEISSFKDDLTQVFYCESNNIIALCQL